MILILKFLIIAVVLLSFARLCNIPHHLNKPIYAIETKYFLLLMIFLFLFAAGVIVLGVELTKPSYGMWSLFLSIIGLASLIILSIDPPQRKIS